MKNFVFEILYFQIVILLSSPDAYFICPLNFFVFNRDNGGRTRCYPIRY